MAKDSLPPEEEKAKKKPATKVRSPEEGRIVRTSRGSIIRSQKEFSNLDDSQDQNFYDDDARS